MRNHNRLGLAIPLMLTCGSCCLWPQVIGRMADDFDYAGYDPEQDGWSKLSEETTLDAKRGLVWTYSPVYDDQSPISTGHENAAERCESLDLDGRGDWRLPTAEELAGTQEILYGYAMIGMAKEDMLAVREMRGGYCKGRAGRTDASPCYTWTDDPNIVVDVFAPPGQDGRVDPASITGGFITGLLAKISKSFDLSNKAMVRCVTEAPKPERKSSKKRKAPPEDEEERP